MAITLTNEQTDEMVNYFVECEKKYNNDDHWEVGDPKYGVDEFQAFCQDILKEVFQALMLVGYKLSERIKTEDIYPDWCKDFRPKWQGEAVDQIVKQIHRFYTRED